MIKGKMIEGKMIKHQQLSDWYSPLARGRLTPDT